MHGGKFIIFVSNFTTRCKNSINEIHVHKYKHMHNTPWLGDVFSGYGMLCCSYDSVLSTVPCPLNTTIRMLHQSNLTKSFVHAWLVPFNVHVRSIGHKLNCVLSKHETHSAGTTETMMMWMIIITMMMTMRGEGYDALDRKTQTQGIVSHPSHRMLIVFPFIPTYFKNRPRTFMTSSKIGIHKLPFHYIEKVLSVLLYVSHFVAFPCAISLP